jgi:hypothetical protein
MYKVQFFQNGSEAFWTIFMEYDPLLERLPNKSIALDSTGKQLFEKLRQLISILTLKNSGYFSGSAMSGNMCRLNSMNISAE